MSGKFEVRLLAARRRYVVDLKERIIVVRAAWHEYLWIRESAGEWADVPNELKSQVHKISGSGGSYGYTEVGNIALELNEALSLLPTSNALSWERISRRVDLLLDRLEESVMAFD